jgi:hypothetical protein
MMNSLQVYDTLPTHSSVPPRGRSCAGTLVGVGLAVRRRRVGDDPL